MSHLPAKVLLFILIFSGFQLKAQLELINAFPGLTFTRPVDLQNAADNSDRIFVVEQRGVILVFENNSAVPAASTFLNITAKVDDSSDEEGLLGLAFHPDYESNGYFYVNYTASGPNRTVISRFKVSDADSNVADPASEFVIIEIDKPAANHNAGAIAFGPNDGFLYITTGDGGGGSDTFGNGQNRETLLAAILRIDVDNQDTGLNYAIPNTNPFVGNVENWREEIFAWGLRNPWRMSFDPVTGWLWCGDVGQFQWEEIDIIESGNNYGWNIMEGFNCFSPSTGCDQTGLALPVWEYNHSLGSAITGGYVYRGPGVPSLRGKYIYGDYGSGRIWSLEYDGVNPAVNTPLFNTTHLLPSFGVSEDGELFICTFTGIILRFKAMAFSTAIAGGWNLVGVPAMVEDSSYAALYPNAAENTLFSFDGAYISEDSLYPGNGYWLNFPAAETAEIEGDLIHELDLNLAAGWNLISGPACTVPVSAISDPGGIITPGTFFGFNGAYVSVTEFETGKSYWVNTTTAGQISINCDAAKQSKSNAKTKIYNNIEPLIKVEDLYGNHQELTLGFDAEERENASLQILPPAPPAGTFDARFDGDRRKGDAANDLILLQSDRYPLTISVSNLPASQNGRIVMSEIIAGKPVAEHPLENGATFQINNPAVKKLSLSRIDNAVPSEFLVEQNYPNPFNPSTVIKYGIPTAGKVKIDIFNTLGQIVTTLFDGYHTAGFHQITWNAADQVHNSAVSGIYFYRVKTESHTIIKKMLFIK